MKENGQGKKRQKAKGKWEMGNGENEGGGAKVRYREPCFLSTQRSIPCVLRRVAWFLA